MKTALESNKTLRSGMSKHSITLLMCLPILWLAACGSQPEAMSLSAAIQQKRPSLDTRIFDHVGLIQNKNTLDRHLLALYDLADIDMVVLILPGLQGNDIDDVATKVLSNWKIGENTKGLKGVLFLLAVEEERVRFEIGYDLEWIYPDSFAGYIERDQMAPFFERGRVQDGIAATLEMIIARANEKIQSRTYSPQDGAKPGPGEFYSGGAGAGRRVQVKTATIPDEAEYPEDMVSLFVPQPTPEAAFLLDIEKCKRHIRGYDFDLYTDETRKISKDWVFTKAQMDNQVNDTRGKTFTVHTKDDLALVVFEPRHRNCAPFYLQKNDLGWQLDMATMSRTIHFDMKNQAHIGKSQYFPIFKENGYTFGVNGFLYRMDEAPACLGVNAWSGSAKVAQIQSIVKNGPAHKAGLQPGDTIVQVGDMEVAGTPDIVRAESWYKIGDQVAVKVKRGVMTKTFDVVLEAYDPFQ
jgi:hypothetical protein